jgi:uncharacterized membrane protein
MALTYLPSPEPIEQLREALGPNGLPYSLPSHPNLVHFTIGLFVIAIAFDVAGALYPLEKRVFRFLALPVTRTGLHDVGWYNLLACCVVTFFTVAACFFEMLLAEPIAGVTSTIGLQSMQTMLWHGDSFMVTTMLIAVPTGVKVFAWLGTLWRGKLRLTRPMLFCLGSLFNIVFAGITGLVERQAELVQALTLADQKEASR